MITVIISIITMMIATVTIVGTVIITVTVTLTILVMMTEYQGNRESNYIIRMIVSITLIGKSEKYRHIYQGKNNDYDDYYDNEKWCNHL